MILITFCQEYSGYQVGKSQYLTETLANQLVANGIAKYAYPIKEDEEDKDAKKAPETPKKDKMVKAPKHKKAPKKDEQEATPTSSVGKNGMKWRK